MATYTTTNQPLPYVQPYLQDYLDRTQQVVNQPYSQSPGTYTAPNPYLQAGWEATANRAMYGSPVMGAANTEAQNVIEGGKLNANPYLDQNIADAQGDLTDAWNRVQKPAWDTAMLNSGSFGNSAVQQANGYAAEGLQKNLGRIASDMRGQNYNQERGYQMQAMGMAPTFAQNDYMDSAALAGVGNAAQQFSQNAANQNQQWWQQAQDYPRQQLNLYGQAVSGQPGGTTSQQTQDPSKLSQVAGGALTGAALWNALFGGG